MARRTNNPKDERMSISLQKKLKEDFEFKLSNKEGDKSVSGKFREWMLKYIDGEID